MKDTEEHKCRKSESSTLKLWLPSKKGKVMISPQLKAAMEDALKADRQIILFQNRRGYAPFLICGTCGFIPQCAKLFGNINTAQIL